MPVGPAFDPLLNPDGALDLAESKRVTGRTREATDYMREGIEPATETRRAARLRPLAKKVLVIVVVLILLMAFVLLGLSWLL